MCQDVSIPLIFGSESSIIILKLVGNFGTSGFIFWWVSLPQPTNLRFHCKQQRVGWCSQNNLGPGSLSFWHCNIHNHPEYDLQFWGLKFYLSDKLCFHRHIILTSIGNSMRRGLMMIWAITVQFSSFQVLQYPQLTNFEMLSLQNWWVQNGSEEERETE